MESVTRSQERLLDASPMPNMNCEDGTKRSVGLPQRVVQRWNGHERPVMHLRWNPVFARLLLSASMDATVRVWDLRDMDAQAKRVFCEHSRGIRQAQWSQDGRLCVSGGFDGRVYQRNVETSQLTYEWSLEPEGQAVTAVAAHPTSPFTYLIGTDRGRICSFDTRVASRPGAQVEFRSDVNAIQDFLFLPQGQGQQDEWQFVSSAAIRQRDASNKTLLVWDLRSGALLHDRLDLDMFSRPSLRLHPCQSQFVAQSSANFATLFRAQPPFKPLHKKMRHLFASHVVDAYSIQCSFRADGQVVASGDANGRVVYYDAVNGKVLSMMQVQRRREMPCLSAEFHPQMRSTLAAAGYDNCVYLYRGDEREQQT